MSVSKVDVWLKALFKKCGQPNWVICQLKDHNEARAARAADALRSCASSCECITTEAGSQISQVFASSCITVPSGNWLVMCTATQYIWRWDFGKENMLLHPLTSTSHDMVCSSMSVAWSKVNIPVCVHALYCELISKATRMELSNKICFPSEFDWWTIYKYRR